MAPRIHRLLPTLPQWLGILFLLLLTSAAWRTALVASDGDAAMHWRVGEWMLEARQLLRYDEFSHTRYGAPVISKEWIAQLLFAGAGRFAGLYGLAFVAALVLAATFALLLRQLLREGHDPLVAAAVTLLASWTACIHWLARPHVFSFLLIVLWHTRLRQFERNRQLRPLLIGLPVLAVVWANVHGGFLAGFLVLGAYWVGAALERDWLKLRHLTLAGLLSGAATLLNPNGYRLHLHNIEFLRSKFLTGWLAEYASTNFHSAGALGFTLWLAAIFFTLVLLRPKFPAAGIVLLLSWVYFALYAGRNVPLLALLTAPLLAGAWSAVVPERLKKISERVGALSAAGHGGWLVAATVIAVAVTPHPTAFPPEHWPVKAVEHIREHPHQFTGKMFNQYIWGGYLLWVLPQHRTFVDARTDFFGEEPIREFSIVTGLQPGWTNILARHEIGWVLMPASHRLNLALEKLPGWSRVYTDAVAQVWSQTP